MSKPIYLYHWIPKNLQGDYLYPLNELKEKLPEVYAQHVKKYTGREYVMDWHVPKLNCRWNDVLHLTAVHPQTLKDALIEAGSSFDYDIGYFQIDPTTLDPKNTVVYMYIHEPINGESYPDEFIPFDPSNLEQYTAIPQITKDYYKKSFSEGRIPLSFPWVPHIFYKGSICIKDLEVVKV